MDLWDMPLLDGAVPLRLPHIVPAGHLDGDDGEVFAGLARCFGGQCPAGLWVGVVSVFLEAASQHQPDSARSGEMNIFD